MTSFLRIPCCFLFVLFVGNSISLAQSSYGSYPPAISGCSVDQMYRSNSQKLLGGLFAPGFTKTLTLMGGANFLDTGPNASFETGGDALGSGFDAAGGSALSFAFGRRHNYRLRSEIELAIRENDVEIGQANALRAYSVIKNFLFDFQNTSRLTPYVGVGLGWSSIDLESTDVAFDTDAAVFSYQAIGGVATQLSQALDLVVEYRFLDTSQADLNEDIGLAVDYQAHNIFLGLKFEY